MEILTLLAGLVAGAGLNYLFQRRGEAAQQAGLNRRQAYADLVAAIAGAAHVADGSSMATIKKAYADAKVRMSIYASPDVLAALAAFDRHPDVRANGDALVALVVAMKQELEGETVDEAARGHIAQVLLGPNRPELPPGA